MIDAGSAARYFWMDTEDDPDLGVGGFPNLRPPFEAFFVEQFDAQLAKKLVEDSRHAAGDDGEFVNYGGLFWAVDLRSPRTSRAIRLRTWAALRNALEESTYDGTVRWGLWCFLFACSTAKSFVSGPHITWLLPIEDNGSVAVDAGGYDPALLSIPHGVPLDQGVEREKYAEAFEMELWTMLFAMCAINSPLSNLRPVGETPYLRFVLDIDHLITKLDGFGNAREAGLAHALLICRSSFRAPRALLPAARADAAG